MYTEFLIIYLGLGVIIILLLFMIVWLAIINKRIAKSNLSKKQKVDAINSHVSTTDSSSKSIVFCKNCFEPYDATYGVCPKCGTPK